MSGPVVTGYFLNKGSTIFPRHTPENQVSSTSLPFSFYLLASLHWFTSNLVSMESPYQGKSSDVGYKMQGQVSIGDISDYKNGLLWIKFKISLPSQLGPLSSGHCLSLNQCPPLILQWLDNVGYVFGVETWVSWVGFQGYEEFLVRMGL